MRRALTTLETLNGQFLDKRKLMNTKYNTCTYYKLNKLLH